MKTYDLESNCLFFADDGALHAPNANELQKQLDECSAWGEEYGMKFAAQKCAVMGKQGIEIPFRIQKGVIHEVTSFVYLGIECKVNGMCFEKKHNERIASMFIYGTLPQNKRHECVWMADYKFHFSV